MRRAPTVIARGMTSLLAALLAAACLAQGASRAPSALVVAAARAQIGKTVLYDGSYRRLAYPGGDVPLERGVCTDVLVRAFRAAGADLQVLVHEDMKTAFDRYPKAWGLTAPDANIDHRRVPNLVVFFRRHAVVLPADDDPSHYAPGDIVAWRLASGVPHIGLVSDATVPGTRRPLVIHNIGQGVQEEDVLFAYVITHHFRYVPPGP